jgi:TRAP-type mannitol/chloroaromatic compound transport system substrate-binding protein
VHKVDLRRLPDDVLAKLKVLSREVVNELAASSPAAKKISASYEKFYTQVKAWDDISEKTYFNVR